MTATSLNLTWNTRPWSVSQRTRDRYRQAAHRRFTAVLDASEVVPFDDSSSLAFFSDCHRGDNSRADLFSPNEELFLHALGHYEQRGFTYVEVGDGDELWQNRDLNVVCRAHGRTHDMLHRLARHGRLHLVLGNHDIQRSRQTLVDKGGLLAHEGLVLEHARTGQRLFVVHGHQADLRSDWLAPVSRWTVRTLWKPMLLRGLVRGTLWASDLSGRSELEQRIIGGIQRSKMRIERRIIEWAQDHRQLVICGHTHRPFFSRHRTRPYFNAGSCVMPGQLTGLEIENGSIVQVRWSLAGGHARREYLSQPLRLSAAA